MYFAEDTIDKVVQENDIVNVISSYVKIKKNGSSYVGLCPFHNEKTPSFSVSSNKQMYYCFGCGAGGNIISFLMQYENLTFPEAVKELANRANIILPNETLTKEELQRADKKSTLLEINKEAAKYYYYNLINDTKHIASNYFNDRKINKETQILFGLGYADKSYNGLYKYLKNKGYDDFILKESGLFTVNEKGSKDKFYDRVIFPIMDINNKVIAFGGRVLGDGMPKYLNSPETVLFDKSKNLYALNVARHSKSDYIILCEGYMDVISLCQAGFNMAVASLGTAFTSNQALLLKRYVKNVIISYDFDKAGINATKRAIPILKEAGLSVKVLNMSPYKDPDDFIKNLGANEYQKRIENASNAFFWEIDVIKRSYDMSDPEEKTKFFNEIVYKLCGFLDPLERDNYISAVSKKYFISYEELKRKVSSIGNKIVSKDELEAKQQNSIERRKKEDGLLKSQKLLLTFLIEDKALFTKVKKYITCNDFTSDLYKEVAKRVFLDYEKGILNPASILNTYIEDEEKLQKVSELFNTNLLDSTNEEDKKKAVQEVVYSIKKASLEKQSQEVNDLAKLQEILEELKKLQVEKINI